MCLYFSKPLLYVSNGSLDALYEDSGDRIKHFSNSNSVLAGDSARTSGFSSAVNISFISLYPC